jgi:hypothetical protein
MHAGSDVSESFIEGDRCALLHVERAHMRTFVVTEEWNIDSILNVPLLVS